jgi:hypothetical protein
MHGHKPQLRLTLGSRQLSIQKGTKPSYREQIVDLTLCKTPSRLAICRAMLRELLPIPRTDKH